MKTIITDINKIIRSKYLARIFNDRKIPYL